MFFKLTVFESQIDLFMSNGSENEIIATANIRPRKKEKPTTTQTPQNIIETKHSLHSSFKEDIFMPEAEKEFNFNF